MGLIDSFKCVTQTMTFQILIALIQWICEGFVKDLWRFRHFWKFLLEHIINLFDYIQIYCLIEDCGRYHAYTLNMYAGHYTTKLLHRWNCNNNFSEMSFVCIFINDCEEVMFLLVYTNACKQCKLLKTKYITKQKVGTRFLIINRIFSIFWTEIWMCLINDTCIQATTSISTQNGSNNEIKNI